MPQRLQHLHHLQHLRLAITEQRLPLQTGGLVIAALAVAGVIAVVILRGRRR